MDPIEALRNEHGLIRRFVDTLGRAVKCLETDRCPPPEFFSRSVEFASDFADTFHHRKEELVMFLQLAEKKSGAIDGQIEALRYQHDQGRSFIGRIRNSLEGYAVGDELAIAEVRECGAAYVSLLRHHIHTEDHIFFPMARTELSDAEIRDLEEEFERERQRFGPETFARYHKVVVDLEQMLEATP